MKNKPELLKLPDFVPLWRRDYGCGVVTVFTHPDEKLTTDRINFLLDCAKQDLMKESDVRNPPK